MPMLKTVSGSTAKDLITSKDGEVRVFLFSALWCGHCQEATPQLNIAVRKLEGIAGFYKIDVDKDEDLFMKYCDEAIPCVVVIRNGRALKVTIDDEQVSIIEGYQDADDYVSIIASASTKRGKK